MLPFESLRGTVAVGKEKHLMERQQKGSQDWSGELIFSERLVLWEVSAMLFIKNIGKTLVTRTQEAKLYLMTSRIAFLKWALLICRRMELHLENWKLLIKMFWAKHCLCNSHEINVVVERKYSRLKNIEDHTWIFYCQNYSWLLGLSLLCGLLIKNFNNPIQKLVMLGSKSSAKSRKRW